MKSGVAKRVLFLVDRRALAAQAVRAFASFEAEPGQKFDKIYEVYSSRFQTRGLRRRQRSSTRRCCRGYLRSAARSRFRLRLHDPTDGNQPLWPQAQSSGLDDEADRRRRRPARYPDPRLRCHRRRRVPSRLHCRGTSVWRNTLGPLRRDQDWPHGYASFATRRATSTILSIAMTMSERSKKVIWWTTMW